MRSRGPAHRFPAPNYEGICPSPPAYDASKLPPALAAGYTAEAGTIAGSFSVSPGGQANYRFPLVVPPGRLGMEPRLAVAYDSSSGDGPLGVGFSLQGLSAVTRCPSSFAQDGYVAPVRNDDTDHFCLDGLRLVAMPVRRPVHGGNTIEYRTFPDTFSKILAHLGPGGVSAGPVSFEVFTKAGHILEYGAAANSQAMATGGVVSAWWLATEQDRRGNSVDYTYENDLDPVDSHTREILPARIDYTRSGTTPASRAVVLEYQAAPITSTLYSAGLELTRSKLLAKISAQIEPNDVTVRYYTFQYGASPLTARNVLQSVAECAGYCKPVRRSRRRQVEPGARRRHGRSDADRRRRRREQRSRCAEAAHAGGRAPDRQELGKGEQRRVREHGEPLVRRPGLDLRRAHREAGRADVPRLLPRGACPPCSKYGPPILGGGVLASEPALETAAAGVVVRRVDTLRDAIPAAQSGRITMGVGLAEDASGAQRVLIGTSEPVATFVPA
jgi:hypothetical protein